MILCVCVISVEIYCSQFLLLTIAIIQLSTTTFLLFALLYLARFGFENYRELHTNNVGVLLSDVHRPREEERGQPVDCDHDDVWVRYDLN